MRLARTLGLALSILVCLHAGARAFETNGRRWASMPIPYWVNPADCPVLDGLSLVELVQQAVEAWSEVACADVRFEFMGTTDAGWAPDGQNTIFCMAEGWSFGPGSAGATLTLPTEPEEPMETDVALNADTLEWELGGPDATQTGSIDPLAVITHELGHFLGLAHTPDPFATMYYGHLPNGLQASLAGDDKAGLCSIYPNGEIACERDEDCEPGWSCTEIQAIPICDELHAGPGEPCDKTYIDCDGMCWVSFYECSQVCLFTRMDYSEGYCAPLCEDVDCPPGFECTYVDQHDIHICFLSDTPDGGSDDGGDGDGGSPDAGDEPADGDGGELADAADADLDAGLPDGGGADADRAADDGEPGADSPGCGCGPQAQAPAGLLVVLCFALRWRRRGSGIAVYTRPSCAPPPSAFGRSLPPGEGRKTLCTLSKNPPPP
ncbi:MAG: matrixin family metalloprotease [Deltaproteobacteria bacterium]|nr:matrixin family metalloprotease [Deltaproteobacteria bacterium]